MVLIKIGSSLVRKVHPTPVKSSVSAEYGIKSRFLGSITIPSHLHNSKNFADVKHVVENPTAHVVPSATSFCSSLAFMQSKIIPHLQAKTCFYKQDTNEYAWIEKDKKALKECLKIILKDPEFELIRSFLSQLIEGLHIHTTHRLDILKHNKDRIIPENGALIREMYLRTEKESIIATSHIVSKINPARDSLTEAFVCSDVRRLIRNIVRIGASQNNLRISVGISLKTSLIEFSERYKIQLFQLKIEPEDIKRFSLPIEIKSSDVNQWLNQQFQGFNFYDLVEKYMKIGFSYEQALKKIIETSTKDNKTVSASVESFKPTRVTKLYKNDMERVELFSSSFSNSHVLRYEIVD